MKDFFGVEIEQPILFYRANQKWGEFSNLYKREIEFEGRLFPTSEHAYQFGKIAKEETREWVMLAPYPHLVPAICHGLFSYDIVPNWNKIKVDRMRRVLRAKFTQHEDLKELLLSTENRQIVEDSKFDSYWGIGKNGKGKNVLGKLLMERRSELRRDEI